MEKINIANLLRNCPKDMEIDCVMYQDVYFDYVDTLNIIHCYIQHETHRSSITFNQFGTIGSDIKTKCVIFPKGKTTWEGFHRPFVDGDIVATNDGKFIAIIKKNGGKYYCSCYTNGNYFITDYSGWFDRFATEEEKAILFQAIKDHGYRWNPETKTLEELPIFKVGDKIKLRNSKFVYTIIDLLKDRYRATTDSRDLYEIEFERQDAYILVPNKFDITSLKPFDKVLARDCDEDKWKIDFFSDYRDDGTYQCMTFTKNQCIPYKGNEHLRNTSDSCDDYFKTWKDE